MPIFTKFGLWSDKTLKRELTNSNKTLNLSLNWNYLETNEGSENIWKIHWKPLNTMDKNIEWGWTARIAIARQKVE